MTVLLDKLCNFRTSYAGHSDHPILSHTGEKLYMYMMLTCPCYVDLLTPHFYIVKLGLRGVCIILLVLL